MEKLALLMEFLFVLAHYGYIMNVVFVLRPYNTIG